MKKLLWMRVGTRVLANGTPGEIVSISSETVNETEIVRWIDVCRDGTDTISAFRPHQIQRDRIRREVSHA